MPKPGKERSRSSAKTFRSQIGKGADQLLPVYFTKQELEQFGEAMEIYRGDLFKIFSLK